MERIWMNSAFSISYPIFFFSNSKSDMEKLGTDTNSEYSRYNTGWIWDEFGQDSNKYN